MVAAEAGVIGHVNATLSRTVQNHWLSNPITSSSRQIFLKRVSLSLTSLKNTPERRVML